MAELTGTLVSHIASFEGNLGKEATWGLINGDISDQEDLQSALNSKAESSDLTDHVNDTNNPHEVTKAQLGLGNVDNTSDSNKPISTATQTALNAKVSDVKVNGQSVVDGMVASVIVPTLTSDLTNNSGFVDKDVNNLVNYTKSSDLSTVATSGSYTDLNNKPSIPTKTSDLTNDSGFIDKDVNNLTNYTKTSSLATVATSGSYSDLSNKPTIPTVNDATLTIQKNGTTVETFTANSSSNKTANITVPTKVSDLTNDSGFQTASDVETTLGSYRTADDQDTIDGGLQDQIDSKASSNTVDNLSGEVSGLSLDISDLQLNKANASDVYTKAESDALLSVKADDSNVVHKTGNEQISGNKRFNNLLYFQTSSYGGYYKFDKDGLTYTKNSVANLVSYPQVSEPDTFLTERTATYSTLENQVVRNIVSDYGTYPRLMKYNSTKTYIILDDRFRVMDNGVIGAGKYFTQRANETDSSRGINITEVANAFGVMSPENNGRWIVYYRCHGTQTITTTKGNTYTIPYYSIRAKVSKTDGLFNYQSRGTIIFECPTNTTWTEDNSNNVYSANANISCWEPFVEYVDVEGTAELIMFYSLIVCNDGVYKVVDSGQTAPKPSNSSQNINKIFTNVSGTTITYNSNIVVLEGKSQVAENGQTNTHSKPGMVSLVNITGTSSYMDTYLGVVENNVNQVLSNPINLNVQIFQTDEISATESQALITNNKSILLPNANESRGAPYIIKLDDGRIMISFMSSQEFKGQKRTDTKENNRNWLVYVSKIPITDISQIDDDMFVKVNFFDFGNSQYGKWGSLANIDGTIYKAFTFGKNTGNTTSIRYGNVVISNK